MVKKFLDQKKRARNFKASNEKKKAKAKGNQSALKEDRENAINGKQKESVGKGDACSVRPYESKRGTFTRSSSPTSKKRRRTTMGKILRKTRRPEGTVHQRKKKAPGAKRRELEPQPASPWWTSTHAGEENDDTVIKTTAGEHTFPLCGQMFRFWDYIFNGEGKMHDSLEEKTQSANKSLVEGRDDFQEQVHAMASEVQRNGGPSVQRILLWERILEQAPNDSGQNFGVGNEGLEKALQDEEKWRETVQSCCTKTARTARNIWRKMKLPFLSENYCGEYVEVHGLDLCGRKECRSELPVKCAHMVEHGVVEEFESNEYESGP